MPKEPLVDVVLTFAKSTKTTHVFGNDDAGITIYIPKYYTAGTIEPTTTTKLRMQITQEDK